MREQLLVPIPEGDYETLSGFLLQEFERIPKEGEDLKLEDWEIIIDSVSDRQIEFVRFKQIANEDIAK